MRGTGWVLGALLLGCRADDAEGAGCPAESVVIDGHCQTCPAWAIAKDGECAIVGPTAEQCAPEMPFDPKTGQCTPILPAAECPPGTMPRLGESECKPVGPICAEGFVSDGTGGCKVSFPETSCSAGQMAVPGDKGCHAVSPCAAGTWGDIPVEASTLYVDASSTATDADGSKTKPFATIGAAIAVAKSGNPLIAIAAGKYKENLSISKPVRLQGVCPEKVEIVGPAAIAPALDIDVDTTVRGVAITGAGMGVLTHGAKVTLDAVWIHDVAEHGVWSQSTIARHGALTLTGSLVENATTAGVIGGSVDVVVDRSEIRGTKTDGSGEDAGILLTPEVGYGVSTLTVKRSSIIGNTYSGISDFGWKATITSTLIRGTKRASSGLFGVGIYAHDHDSTRVGADVTVEGCVVEGNAMGGIDVFGSKVVVRDTVIRDTLATTDGRYGQGISASIAAGTKKPSELTLERILVDHNVDGGVVSFGSKIDLRSSIIRDTAPNKKTKMQGSGIGAQRDGGVSAEITATDTLIETSHMAGALFIGSNGTFDGCVVRRTQPLDRLDAMGRGIVAQDEVSSSTPSKLSVSRTLIDDNYEAGVLVLGAEATLDTLLVRGTKAGARTQIGGQGIVATIPKETTTATTLSLMRSLIVGNMTSGVFLVGATGTIESTIVRDTAPSPDGKFGRGIGCQPAPDGTQSSLTLRDSAIEGSHEAGLYLSTTPATIERLRVLKTAAREDGSFGDGVLVLGRGAGGGVTLGSLLVRDSTRAGVGLFGGSVSLTSARLACGGFDIDIEPYEDLEPEIIDGGGNVCGCGTADTCKGQSNHIAPLEALPPPPTR